MIVALIVCFLAVLLCLFDRKHAKRKFGGLELGFLLLTIYLCIRYDYGNDYLGYLDDFYNYNSFGYSITDIDALAGLQSRGDYGWVMINLICEPIGFFGMIMLLTVLFMGQVYYYIKRYVPPKWYWFSVFLFAFHPLLMVVGVAGMIRQWTATFIFLCCIGLIKKRKIIPYMAIILAATTIHKTAYILFPVYFVTYFKWNHKNSIALFFFLLLTWYALVPYIPIDLIMLMFDNEQLAVYGEFLGIGTASGYGISSILVIGMPLLCLSQIRDRDESTQLLYRLMMLSILFIPLLSLNSLIGRLVAYFSIMTIIAYPLTIESLLQKRKVGLCYAIIAILMIYYLYIFTLHFKDPVWYNHAYIYRTIFSVPWQ